MDAGKQGLMQWLLRRVKTKSPFDGNKLYASELLSILLQHTPENRLLLGDLDGIDVLLQQLAVHIYTLFCILYSVTFKEFECHNRLFTVLQEARSANCRGTRDDGEFI